MSDAFDPYYQWLGIPPKDQPPHYYRLLGIDPFEDDSHVISLAAERLTNHVRTFQSGPYARQLQEVLYAIVKAKECLLNPQQKAIYDRSLHERLPAAYPSPAPATQPAPPPAEPSVPPTPMPPPISSPHATPVASGFAAVSPATQNSSAATYQPPPVYDAGPSFPPPVPVPSTRLVSGLLVVALVATTVCAVWIFIGLAGWLVWSYSHEGIEPQAMGEPPEAISPRKKNTPVAVAPTRSPFVEVPAEVQVVPAPKPIAPREVAPPQPRISSSPLQDIRNGLAHWWGLHETSGPRHDSVSLLNLADPHRVGSAPGVVGTSARFNGKQFFQAGNDPSLQLRGNKTFAMWVKFSTMTNSSGQRGSHAMLGKWSAGSGHDYIVSYNYLRDTPNQFEFVVWDTVAKKHQVVYSSFSGLRTNAWYFVVCRYDSESSQIGISVNDGPFNNLGVGPVETSENSLYVGADHGPPWNSLQGGMALLGIWNRLLTAAEITALYNNGRGVDIDTLPRPN